MVRKIFLCIFGFLAFFMAFYYFFLSADYETVYHNQQMMLQMEPKEDLKNHPILDSINAQNRSIRSFYCSDLTANVQHNSRNRAIKLTGFLAYEKENKVRLKLDSIVGNELDVGSDGNVFWFWSKRMNPPGLYWAKLSDAGKTKLKSPFNPHWLAGCLGFEEINYHNATIDQNDNQIRIMRTSLNGTGQQIKIVTIVDPKQKKVIGHGLYDANDNLVASSEIQDFYNSIPKKITFIWYKENAQMIWYLSNPKTNLELNPNNWKMPNYRPLIDMNHDHGGYFEL